MRLLARVIALITTFIVVGACSGGAAQNPNAGTELMITSPSQGSVVTSNPVTVKGTAPPGSRVVQDISFALDQEVVAGTDGRWTMSVDLDEGANELVFRIGDDKSTQVSLGLTLSSVAVMSPSTLASPSSSAAGTEVAATPGPATPTPAPTPIATPTPTPFLTPEPTPEPLPEPEFVTFGDGTFVVGEDVAPGTYRLRYPGYFCYWARLSGFGGTLGEIIANDNAADGFAVVTIGKGDAGFESTGCEEWSNDLSQLFADRQSINFDGTYIVNTDILPGTWRSTGGDFCYWARLKGFGGTLNDIIANNNVLGGPTVVSIAKSDKGFLTRGCGTWIRK